jgi:hypothetical protein
VSRAHAVGPDGPPEDGDESSAHTQALLDLYDQWSSVIWCFARRRAATSSQADRAVVDAFGTAVADPALFHGPSSALARLRTLIDSAAGPKREPERPRCGHRCPLSTAGGPRRQ